MLFWTNILGKHPFLNTECVNWRRVFIVCWENICADALFLNWKIGRTLTFEWILEFLFVLGRHEREKCKKKLPKSENNNRYCIWIYAQEFNLDKSTERKAQPLFPQLSYVIIDLNNIPMKVQLFHNPFWICQLPSQHFSNNWKPHSIKLPFYFFVSQELFLWFKSSIEITRLWSLLCVWLRVVNLWLGRVNYKEILSSPAYEFIMVELWFNWRDCN